MAKALLAYTQCRPPTTCSPIFYTFHEAQNLTISPDLSRTPLLSWLRGGPGRSSMIGNFFELMACKF
ncbi:hypothetical protein CerSpe_212570 [Prunus speciosa]